MVSSTASLASPGGALAPEQVAALDAAIAPLTADQLIWASGYTAGLAAARRDGTSPLATSASPIAAAADIPELTIVYGSQTGHSESVAAALHQSAEQAGFAAKLLNMSDLSARKLAKAQWIALVVSTHGEGDPPDDAVMLLEQLRKPRAPKLEAVKFSVLALGDSSYAQFCQTGKDFEAALLALGATAVAPLVECDVDYQSAAAEWRDRVLNDYRNEIGGAAGRPALQVVQPSSVGLRETIATVVANQRITGSRSSKVVHHVELASDAPLDYQPGDSLGLRVANPDTVVNALIESAALDASDEVQIEGKTASVYEALKHSLEVTRITGPFLDAYAKLDGVESLQEALETPEGKKRVMTLGHIADVAGRYPHAATAQAFVETLRPLQHRLYSIASSPLETPDEVHLTVAEVQFEVDGTERHGAVSRAVVDQFEEGDEIEVFVEPNTRFRLPEHGDTDVIMIGPGTGVAPFRSFVEHRAAQEATGRNWLFFGDRTFSEDFLYQSEWQAHLRDGALTRIDLAFSRDQQEKVYVQDRLREHAAELLEWIEGGAAIYVCGDAGAMAPDVHAALIEILAARHDGDLDAGATDLETLRRERRYLRDVY
ncbi:MAG: flavodoxin domain-containing protein [Pseudomonadota bacterium]